MRLVWKARGAQFISMTLPTARGRRLLTSDKIPMEEFLDKHLAPTKTSPPLIGINMWEKLQGKMVATCDNFAKSAEACRKKWKAIYSQYCTDKRLLQISGEGRKVTCRFYKEIDEGFANMANVRKMCHGDARGNPNPCPPDINEVGEAEDSAEAPAEGTNQGTSMKEESSQGSKAPKKTSGEQITSILSDFVIHSKDMVKHSDRMATQTTRIADDIHLHGIVLKELQVNLSQLIAKL